MSTLIEFLTARFDEDEAAARAAIDPERPGTRWQWVNDDTDEPIGDLDEESAISGLSLRTVEQFASDLPTAWVGDGLLPAFVIHTAEEVIPGAGDHIARHDPARVLREVAAKRRVMARHHLYDGTALYDYCAGCPTGDETGYPDTELKDCPELQDLAFIWNEHEDWNQEWCPHVEGRHEEDVTEVPPARGCYTNACNRCGTGDGWHYRKDRVT